MSLMDEYLSIDTPENVVFNYEVAGIGSRFLAALLDTLIILFLQVIVSLLMLLLVGWALPDDGFAWLAAVLGLLSFALLWGYYIYFEMTWNGQSPGKRKAGLRVIRSDGTPITFTESVIRNLVRLIDFLPLYYGVGIVSMFIDEKDRRLGDLAAGTLVVRDRGPIRLDKAARPALRRPFGAVVQEIDLPVERLTVRDIEMAESFLRRRDEIAHRSMVARRISQALAQKMELPAEETYPPEGLIWLVVQSYREREVG